MTAMESAIRGAVNQRIQDIVKEETEKAVEKIRSRSLETVAASVLGVLQWTDFTSMSDRLVVTVRFPDKEKQPS